MLLFGAVVWCCCLVLFFGDVLWCCCLVIFFGAVVWCCCFEYVGLIMLLLTMLLIHPHIRTSLFSLWIDFLFHPTVILVILVILVTRIQTREVSHIMLATLSPLIIGFFIYVVVAIVALLT